MFRVDIHFKDVCKKGCKSLDLITEKCDSCKAYMKKDMDYWNLITYNLDVKIIDDILIESYLSEPLIGSHVKFQLN